MRNGLKLKRSKCRFAGTKVKCLGHIMFDHGILTDPEKIEAIRSWPPPTIARKIQKEEIVKWSSACSNIFELVKSALINAPILTYSSLEGIFILDGDGNNIGAVLAQIQCNSSNQLYKWDYD